MAVATSSDGKRIYLANDVNVSRKEFAAYSRDPTTGNLSLSDALEPPTMDFSYARIVVAPGDTHVYAAADGLVGPSGAVIAVYEVLPSPCSAAPLTGCRGPVDSGKGKIDIRNDVPNTRDRLRWNWVRGEATAEATFGDPSSTTYTLCVYDELGALSMTARAPAAELCGTPPCWKAVAGGFKYQDPFKSPDGVSSVRLKAGAEGRPKIKLKGSRLNLDPPALPLTSPVTAQLQASNGECWEARYDSFIIRNDSTGFQARSD